jgi:hypothetical protein
MLNELEFRVQRDIGVPDFGLTGLESLVLKLADILELCAWAKYCQVIHGTRSAELLVSNGTKHAKKLLTGCFDDNVRNATFELMAEIECWTELLPHHIE